MSGITSQALGLVDAVENIAGVACNVSPFYPGAEAVVIVDCDGYNGTCLLQTSPDNSTWTTHTTITEAVSDRSHTIEVADLDAYIRLSGTVWTAGNLTATMLG